MRLRTPLGSIKGYATTLLTHGNKLKRDEQREFLEIIDSEADRLRELIEAAVPDVPVFDVLDPSYLALAK